MTPLLSPKARGPSPRRRALTFAALFVAAACASIQRDTPTESGFLGDYSNLHRVEGEDEPELLYVDSRVDWKSYTKVLLDPVTIWRGKDDEIDVSMQDAQTMANNFYKLVYEALASDFAMVHRPEPHTLRIQVALTRVSTARTFLNVVTSMDPQLHALGMLEGYVGLKPPFTGQAQVELRVLDATTGHIAMESVDRRVGKRQLIGSWDSWRTVDDALRFWASQLRFMLCKQQGKPDCKPPVAAKGF